MSAQKTQPRGVFGAIVGFLGFSALAGLLVTVMVTPAIAVTGMTASSTIGIFDSLPEYIAIEQQPERNEIFANGPNGPERIAIVYDQNREEVKWDQVPQFVKDAAVAGEDRRFYEHGGVDVQGVVRAAAGNLAAGGISSGASTLSMQLVKNIFIQEALELPTKEQQDAAMQAAQETSFSRKLKEMKLAIGMEKEYSKNEILLAYLNIAGFGGNTYGIQAAAQNYYSKNVWDLTLAESASLIAIVQEPGARGLQFPENYPANQARRDVILDFMLSEGFITEEQHKEAVATPVDETTVRISQPTQGCIAAHVWAKTFCDYVVRNVKNLESLGASPEERAENWRNGGYDIHTTLDLDLTGVAYDAVHNITPNTETRLDLGSVATTVEVGTGRVLVMAQNKDFDNSQDGGGPTTTALNLATDYLYGGSSGFQAGSTFKVFTLLNWLQSGHGLQEVVNVNERTYNSAQFLDTCNGPHGGPWPLRNDAREAGNYTILEATKHSVNGGYAQMGLQLDLCETRRIAEKLGVHTAVPEDNPDTPDVDETAIIQYPSGILGVSDIAPLTMAAAYAGIANNGLYCKPIVVDKIFAPDRSELPGQRQECAQAVDPEVAKAAIVALKAAMSTYPARTFDGTPLIGKTGTTDSSEDTWVMSASTEVATAVWVGNITGKVPIREVNGRNWRHDISRTVMLAANQQYPGGDWEAPSGRYLIGQGVLVPDGLIGGTLEQARALIESAGLTFADGGQVDSDQPAGAVARVEPGAGTRIARGATVTVYTSNGAQIGVPDVVSGNPTFNSARSALRQAGFRSVAQECVPLNQDQAALANRVVSMDPAAGSSVNKNTVITLGVGQLNCGNGRDDDD